MGSYDASNRPEEFCWAQGRALHLKTSPLARKQIPSCRGVAHADVRNWPKVEFNAGASTRYSRLKATFTNINTYFENLACL